MKRLLRTLAFMGAGGLIGLLLFSAFPVAHALPEYATRTGEPCSTCHVNPAGGGPRTVRGNLWVAAGKPDKVPPLPGEQPATAAAGAAGALDDSTIYQKSGCAACHGVAGEGGVGPALTGAQWAPDQVTSIVRNGKGTMPGAKSTALSDADLAAIVRFVQAIGRGEVKPPAPVGPQPLPPAQVLCTTGSGATLALVSCGGN
jgi:mono/diheme cytochrome c family protein